MTRATCFALLLSTVLPPVASASGGDGRNAATGIDVTLTRLRYESGGNYYNASGFGGHFNSGASGINETDLRDIYIAKVWEPAPADVRNVVVMSAGQSFTDGVHNAVTGQNEHYKWNGDDGMTRTHRIAGNSLARQAMTRFDPSDTALVLIFDAQFEYENTPTQRTAVKNAFRSWVYGLASDPEVMYWAGSSRGGALGLMIAADLTTASFPNFSDTEFIVQGIDPVFRHGEFGVYDHFDKIQNPFETSIFQSWLAQELDIRAQFGDDPSRLDRVMTKIITTGDQVVLVGEGALPWGEWSNGAPRSGDNEPAMLHIFDGNGNAFYEGSWVYQPHTDLGRNYLAGPGEWSDQVHYRDQPMLDHLDNALAAAECPGRWTYACYERTGCPVEDFTCICDAPYVHDGTDCVLSCADGEYYDAELDSCVELCPTEDNLWWNPVYETCECIPEAEWSPVDGCVVCETSDWDAYNQSCCPSYAPRYNNVENECFSDCTPDSYWDFDDDSNLGHCVDYCDPCEDPVWQTVCTERDGLPVCTNNYTCEPQCNAGEVCGTNPARFGFDQCIPQQRAASQPWSPAGVHDGRPVGTRPPRQAARPANPASRVHTPTSIRPSTSTGTSTQQPAGSASSSSSQQPSRTSTSPRP